MSTLWKILLEDGSAPSSGGGDVASSDSSAETTSTTPEGASPEGDDTPAATDGDRFIDAPPEPELDNTDNGDEEPGSAGGLEPAPSPTLSGDAAIKAILAQAQAPAPAPAPQQQAPAPTPTPAPAAPDVAAVVKSFADAVGIEANDPALKSFTDVLTTAQSEALAAKQALAQQSQRASAERLFAVMESAPGYTAEVFGEADTLSPDATFGLTPEQMQRRVAVDLEAANLYKAAQSAGKPISAKAAIRQAVQKIAGFYAKPAAPKPAAPKPQASATAMAPGRTQRREVDVFKQAVKAFHSSKSSKS